MPGEFESGDVAVYAGRIAQDSEEANVCFATEGKEKMVDRL